MVNGMEWNDGDDDYIDGDDDDIDDDDDDRWCLR